ncbi:site-specific DNA-methyltransferase [Paenibacillus sp. WLX2291]|uniref:site-specific DNA-methyltransferase n=1 Tax=Paenibacillus sp. WLX2291 TaxID=3296934 RepID=UPI0039842D0F
MKKMRMSSPYITDQNIAKIGELFPNVLTETHDEQGELKQAIDFELLKQELSEVIVEGDKERYQLTWPGKKEAILNANSPIDKTLRPVKEDSVDWENTQNLYIEGDNLDVMKLLQESYLNKVKCIYIDPPYNTGQNFIYKDDYKEPLHDYLSNSGQVNEQGEFLFKNTEKNGRFHSDWLSMMYSRVKVAKNLMRDDGVIGISVDDNEIHNIKKICDEIFNEQNFEGHIHWRRRHNQPNDRNKMIGLVAEHLIVYSKDREALKRSGVGKVDLTGEFSNPDNDSRGEWASKPWAVASGQNGSKYSITSPIGKKIYGEWMGDENNFKKLLEDNRIYFPKNGEGKPRKKYFLFEREEEGQCATNWWSHEEFGHNQGANEELYRLMGSKNIFSNPKPIELIRGLLQIANVENQDIVLDFFSGTATTAHAVLKLNSEDNINRKYIMVQLQEDLDKSYALSDSKNKETISNAIEFLNGIDKKHCLTEIGKERIRRAANKIKQDTNADIDYGFRVYKVASSNMKDIYYTPDKLGQLDLLDLQSNIKEDRSAEDLLIQVMLELGLELSLPMSSKHIDECIIYDVDNHKLTACFEENISESIMKQMAAMKPEYAVFRDHSFQDDSARINVHELFKLLSPNTDVRVL